MTFRVTADVGGTFTDVVVADDSGHLTVGKAPSSRKRIFEGVQAALADAAGQLSIAPSALLGEANLFVYSTTHATNAIIEGATATTAFLTTDGFPDILVRREGGKLNPFDFTEPYPASYVPRRLTFEIRERVDAEGGVTTPLDVEQARSVLRRLGPLGVEAIAVCLLWSIANPAHELLLGDLIDEELPGVAFTLSHQLNPIIREYRRASSTAIDASLKPLMQRHFGEFESDLRHTGFTGELVAAISVGGVMHIGDVIERPIYSVKSGPAMAPIAGRVYADAEAGERNVIVCDTGGTSFDVSLVRDAMLVFTRETWLGPRFTGHLTGLSSVDVRSFGAGGGSIAWIDPGGLLRVGPASAGAEPGPACYGRGGTDATVTDAAAVLGYLNPEFFLGGSMPLDVEASRTAVGALAEVLAIGVEETAQAIVAVANEHMIEAIKQLTVNEGIDPRESLIVAGGGAAGMNIVPIARELGCKRVLVPRTAGALSACGAQYSDIVAEFGASSFTTTAEFDFEAVNTALREIDALIEEFFSGLRERGFSESRTEYFVEARYPAQVWDLELPLRSGGFGDQADVDELARDFHTGHKRVFAVAEPEQYVELLQWKGRLTVPLSKPALERSAAASGGSAGKRRTVFAGVGEVAASTYRGDMLAPGMKIDGPAVIEEATTTIVVYPGSCATVTPLGNYLLEL